MSPIRVSERHRYPPDWAEISAAIRFGRAGGRCECEGECGSGRHQDRCESEHGQPSPYTGTKVVLTTAHRNHVPEEADPAALFAACPLCHLSYDREHHAETRRATRRAALAAAGQGELFPVSSEDSKEAGRVRWAGGG